MRRHLSYANIVASIALIFALSGVAYAATQLPKNSVGSKQLTKNSVNTVKVKDGSLRAADFKEGQLPAGPKGETGARGPEGPQGPAGTAKAYGVVLASGNLATGSAVGGLQVTRASEGIYCISLADGGSVNNIQVSTDYSSSSTNYWNLTTKQFTIAGVVNNQACADGGKQVRVYQIDVDGGTMNFDDAQFRVIVP